jgi:hypothetical protein
VQEGSVVVSLTSGFGMLINKVKVKTRKSKAR